MAYIFFMNVSFRDEAVANRFAAEFDASPFDAPHNRVYLLTGVAKHYGSPDWECCIIPSLTPESTATYLNGCGGTGDDKDNIEDLNCAADVLYKRLAKLDGYSYALLAWEPGGAHTIDSLTADFSPGGFLHQYVEKHPKLLNGLVLHEQVWNDAQRPDGFVKFGASHVWRPWTTVSDLEDY